MGGDVLLELRQLRLRPSEFVFVPIHLAFVIRRLLLQTAYLLDAWIGCRDERHDR